MYHSEDAVACLCPHVSCASKKCETQVTGVDGTLQMVEEVALQSRGSWLRLSMLSNALLLLQDMVWQVTGSTDDVQNQQDM